MKKTLLISLALIFSFQIFSQNTVRCSVKTSEGEIVLELYPEKAPITVTNFLKYVDSGLYSSSSFFRVCTPQNEAERDVKIEVIQGGNVIEEKCFDSIDIETTEKTGLLHKNGTISMARDTPNSATCSFFICIDNQPELDFKGNRNPDGQGFAAFGKVTKGMDVVLKIQNGENKDQSLVNPINIISIERID